MTDTDAMKSGLVRNGRAMVQVIEGLEILKDDAGSWRETLLLNLTLGLYRHRLQNALGSVPREVMDEIMKASHAGATE